MILGALPKRETAFDEGAGEAVDFLAAAGNNSSSTHSKARLLLDLDLIDYRTRIIPIHPRDHLN